MKKTAIILKVEELGGDNFYTVEINNQQTGETEYHVFCAESLQELIRRQDIELSYNEEFETEEGLTIEQAMDSDSLHYVEVAEEEGEWDVYFHKVTVKYGEIEYDFEGEFIRTYKTEKGALNKAKQLAL